MSYIFVSYSRVDADYASQLANDLRKRGFDVWIDNRIDYGDRWFSAIEQAIEGCTAFVLLMTPHSKSSEWVQKEILIAKRDAKPIFPVLKDGREFAIVIDLQYADVRGGGLPSPEFYERLQHILPQKRASGTLIAPPELKHHTTQIVRRGQRPLLWLSILVLIAVTMLVFLFFINSEEVEAPEEEPIVQIETPSPSPTVTDTAIPPTSTPGATPFGGARAGQLAFVSDQDGPRGIYLLSITEGGMQIDLIVGSANANTRANYLSPAWAPDGERLAFITDESGHLDLCIMDVTVGIDSISCLRVGDGTGWSSADQENFPAWSPDGTRIAFVSDHFDSNDIFVIEVNDLVWDIESLMQLTGPPDNDTAPQWLPDGERLLVTSQPLGDGDGVFEAGEDYDLWIIDMDGTEPIRVTSDNADQTAPALSHDGTRLAYESFRSGRRDIYIRTLDGGEESEIRLTNHVLSDQSPAWSPDGQWLAFYSARDGNNEIYLLEVDGLSAAAPIALTTSPEGIDNTHPAWRP